MADSLKASSLTFATFYDAPTAVFPLPGFGVEGKVDKILAKLISLLFSKYPGTFEMNHTV